MVHTEQLVQQVQCFTCHECTVILKSYYYAIRFYITESIYTQSHQNTAKQNLTIYLLSTCPYGDIFGTYRLDMPSFFV